MARKPKVQPISVDRFNEFMEAIAGFDKPQLETTIERAKSFLASATKKEIKKKEAEIKALQAEVDRLKSEQTKID